MLKVTLCVFRIRVYSKVLMGVILKNLKEGAGGKGEKEVVYYDSTLKYSLV